MAGGREGKAGADRHQWPIQVSPVSGQGGKRGGMGQGTKRRVRKKMWIGDRESSPPPSIVFYVWKVQP